MDYGPPMPQIQDRFGDGADKYQSHRPDYPASLLKRLIAAVPETPAPAILDVGCGTGIFTRQLRKVAPAAAAIVGIDPSEAMLEIARNLDTPGIGYTPGTAERLPVPDRSAAAIVAATAAHWFDRPAFYREARRALRPGGLLAIIEYVRDEANSPAAGIAVEFLHRHGGPRAYERPDYAAELKALHGFPDVGHWKEAKTLELSFEEFAGLVLSSSHARPAIETMGRAGAAAALEDMTRAAIGETAVIPFGYVFNLFMAKKAVPGAAQPPDGSTA